MLVARCVFYQQMKKGLTKSLNVHSNQLLRINDCLQYLLLFLNPDHHLVNCQTNEHSELAILVAS